jgi:hypothetical protein
VAAPDQGDIAEAITGLEADGYTGQFIPRPHGHLQCLTCNTPTHADELRVHALRRLEGVSDPDDMAAVVALECPVCGARGTVVLKYGAEISLEEAEVLRLLEHGLRRSP